MNKIAKKHYTQIFEIDNGANIEQDEKRLIAAENCAAATEEGAVKFAEWMIDSGYKRTNGKIYWVNDVEPSLYRAESELFHHPDFLATL